MILALCLGNSCIHVYNLALAHGSIFEARVKYDQAFRNTFLVTGPDSDRCYLLEVGGTNGVMVNRNAIRPKVSHVYHP